jgi:hypothetical protein
MDTETIPTQANETREDAVARVLDSAARMGIELDEQEAQEWVTAMGSEAMGGEVVVDVDSGVYGHRVTMLDFSQQDLARFREMAEVVGFQDRPGIVSTALALSGSAAQSKIHTFPADCDFFERVHIKAESRDDACAILADVIREKALATASGPTYRLWEVKFGTYREPVVYRGKTLKPGAPTSWNLAEVQLGQLEVELADGTLKTITWADAAREPGGCKLDWVIADRARGRLANASNVLDVTWERPDGGIVPLDGFLDPYFQEVYLEAESIPLFSKLVKQLSGNAVDEYVEQLEHEVWKYTVKEQNYGKAARRMYNVFRLTGRYHEASYIRELFDEPVTALYQVAALIRTLDDAAGSDGTFDPEILVAQTDQLIMSAITALEGPTESQVVRHLLNLRDSLRERGEGAGRQADISSVRDAAMGAVNDYFERMLVAVPGIKTYLDEIAQREG